MVVLYMQNENYFNEENKKAALELAGNARGFIDLAVEKNKAFVQAGLNSILTPNDDDDDGVKDSEDENGSLEKETNDV
eukprot:CAMPEP_0118701984 /NCGR_PEP_ID=MMETSP0800-20121206/17599_1 /TAXON_ID=210618 ORGANISM="Striatella unipunctata, Strain CCMP2910" /NCGR_SAMPLE_ID=MMETSP0800 /ASSEMBLY_ACC=CAM_ASM_000638 /LENGTH=77 /DNA_ID=CAMNT_0006603055 /DNA_START=89 /DNA_END=319 /DNA_ORIENTATION=-